MEPTDKGGEILKLMDQLHKDQLKLAHTLPIEQPTQSVQSTEHVQPVQTQKIEHTNLQLRTAPEWIDEAWKECIEDISEVNPEYCMTSHRVRACLNKWFEIYQSNREWRLPIPQMTAGAFHQYVMTKVKRNRKNSNGFTLFGIKFSKHGESILPPPKTHIQGNKKTSWSESKRDYQDTIRELKKDLSDALKQVDEKHREISRLTQQRSYLKIDCAKKDETILTQAQRINGFIKRIAELERLPKEDIDKDEDNARLVPYRGDLVCCGKLLETDMDSSCQVCGKRRSTLRKAICRATQFLQEQGLSVKTAEAATQTEDTTPPPSPPPSSPATPVLTIVESTVDPDELEKLKTNNQLLQKDLNDGFHKEIQQVFMSHWDIMHKTTRVHQHSLKVEKYANYLMDLHEVVAFRHMQYKNGATQVIINLQQAVAFKTNELYEVLNRYGEVKLLLSSKENELNKLELDILKRKRDVEAKEEIMKMNEIRPPLSLKRLKKNPDNEPTIDLRDIDF